MEEDSVLDVIHELTQTDRAFFNVVRFLDGNTRNHLMAAHLRNTSQALAIVRGFMATQRPRPPQAQNIVMNIPLNSLLDPSGNFMRNFLDPVPIVPTPTQIQAAVENNIQVSDINCAICQETVTSATRIRHCGHCFHSQCIHEWFTMNTRCPICRHDIRDLQPSNSTSYNDSSMHTNEE